MNQVERKVAVMNLEQNNKIDEHKTEEDSQEKLVQSDIKQQDAEVTPQAELTEKVAEAEAVEETVEQVEQAESEPEQVEATTEDSEQVSTETEESADNFYAEIVKKAKEFTESNDWSFVSNELANLNLHVEEGPAPDSEESKKLIKEFGDIRAEFEVRKREHYEALNKKREENLVKKKDLLKEFTDIINNERWSATKEVAQISNKWDQIKQLPHNEVEALNERFAALVTEFEDHKVDRLVKKLQKEEENLTLKLVLQDKMDAIIANSESEESNFDALNKELDDLIPQWRKVGRVPVEKNEHVWDRFNNTVDNFNNLRFKYDKQYRKAIEKALEHKKKLVADAEQLIDQEDIAEASRRVNKLHKAWKKTKSLPQKDENELWEKFKAAT